MRILIALSLAFLLVLPACRSDQESIPEKEASVVQETGTESGEDSTRVIAKVGDRDITLAELDEKVAGLTSKFREMSPNLKFNDQQITRLRVQFLDRLIHDIVLLQEAERRNISVSDEEIQTRIDQLQKIFGPGEEGRQRFMSGIRDMDRFHREIEKQTKIQKLIDSEIQAGITADEETLKKFYQNNPDKFKEPAKAKYSQIIKMLPRDKDGAVDSAKKEEIRNQLEEIVVKLRAGADFGLMAREESEDERTREKGGDVGYVEEQRMAQAPVMKETIFSIDIGKISDVVESSSFLAIIKVEDRVPERQLSYEEDPERVERAWRSQEMKRRNDEFYNSLLEKTKIEKML